MLQSGVLFSLQCGLQSRENSAGGPISVIWLWFAVRFKHLLLCFMLSVLHILRMYWRNKRIVSQYSQKELCKMMHVRLRGHEEVSLFPSIHEPLQHYPLCSTVASILQDWLKPFWDHDSAGSSVVLRGLQSWVSPADLTCSINILQASNPTWVQPAP